MKDESRSVNTLDQKFEQNKEIFRLLVSSVKDYAIFMLDPGGHVMTWNDGAQRIKGYTAEEIIGQHFSKFYTEDAKAVLHPQEELAIACKDGRYEEEGWRVRKDGSTFWANVVITAIYEQDVLIGFAKVTRDLTERKMAEEQREADSMLLMQTNEELERALEVKDRFLSTMSHEIRTPISGIIGLAELLSLKNLGTDNNALICNIFESSKRLLKLLNDILDIARLNSSNMTVEFRMFPIRAMLSEVRQLIAPEAARKQLIVKGTCDDAIPEHLCGDEFRLRQIWLNLAFNAVKFTETGEVDIGCTVKEEKEETTIIRFSVSDTGIGVSSEDQVKLFKPFVQAQGSIARVYGGTGLGLNISKNLVELMGGTIGMSSNSNKGSIFWFEIPFDHRKC